jgi:hypothetical protein
VKYISFFLLAIGVVEMSIFKLEIRREEGFSLKK